jgi:hypothetical protein
VGRVRRNRSYKLAQIYDRRSREVPFNAEVAEVEIDNPLALDPGEKIMAIRSIRSDPLGRLHSHHRAERGPQAIDPTREYVDGARTREPVTESQRQAVLRLNRIERELGTDGAALVHDVLVLGLTMDQIGQRRAVRTQRWNDYFARRFRECLDRLALIYGFATEAGTQRADQRR